ncbi:putative cytoskeleton organization protein [Stachybotrys elegans]|uniref:Cytoskeleton organization protein n=1 Tax=Stachybotrys elegans TaxID=80388 RepID=A0A8K0SKG7_9HYPO|nr:putative cytoskeleton organization protein [Stachybotrys elegans]
MYRPQPRLRSDAGPELENAYYGSDWPQLIRLAEKHWTATKDVYYEILAICAKSQLDDPIAKFGALSAVWNYVDSKTLIKDIEGIDLLDWATYDLAEESDHHETLGALRVRLVKSDPKNRPASLICLRQCLRHWDLISAQQISAILDKSFPEESNFMFWNIILTHLLATSPDTPPEKKKLYGALAQRQIERAAGLTEKQEKTGTTPPRSVQTEQDILLLYHIVEAHGSPADLEKLTSSPIFAPLEQFRRGNREVFAHCVARLHSKRDWKALFPLCKELLSKADSYDKESLQTCDWSLWKKFIDAASNLESNTPGALKEAQDLLSDVTASQTRKPVYARNLQLAKLTIAFTANSRAPEGEKDGEVLSTWVQELQAFIQSQLRYATCFGDIKPFVEKLEPGEMQSVAYKFVPELAAKTDNRIESARAELLSLKLQYLLSSTPATYTPVSSGEAKFKCTICGTSLKTRRCHACLAKLSQAALDLHAKLTAYGSGERALQKEILPDLAILITYCLVRQSFLGLQTFYTTRNPAILRNLLRALLILEQQLSQCPKHAAISMLLVSLHLMFGSGHRARDIWDTLGVKRTIVDSLGPHFFDRVSTVAPSVISPLDDRGWEFMDTLSSHYRTSLWQRAPSTMLESFFQGSYLSLLTVPNYVERLRSSSTRALSLVEEARSERLFGHYFEDYLQEPRYTEVTDDLKLLDSVDYGSFPSWDASSAMPAYARLRIGPQLSNSRMHLSLLAEAFHDVLVYKPPPTHDASSNADQVYVLEKMSQICNSLQRFIPNAATSCTSAEAAYYRILGLLSGLLPLGASLIASPAHVADFTGLKEAVEIALQDMHKSMPLLENNAESTVTALASIHNIAILRDAAIAVRTSSRWLVTLSAREHDRDKSGTSVLPQEAISQLKDLQTTSEAVLYQESALMVKMNENLSTGRGFEAQLKEWLSNDGSSFQALSNQKPVGELVGSWRSNLDGWQQVSSWR